MTATISLRALNRALLARQRLLDREPVPLARVVASVVALQAQWPKLPFLGLLARLPSFERADLARSLERREVVRATSMRATIHLTTAEDYPAIRAAIAPVLERGLRPILRRRGAGFDVAKLLHDARRALERSPLTFGDLRDRMVALQPKGDARAMGYAVRMMLPLVMEPTDARWSFPADARFALADRWLDHPLDALAGAEERAVLLRRYLAAYGPASVADAQSWTGLQGLRADFEALRPSLVVFRDARTRELFDLPDAPRPDEETPAPPRLLPEFDHTILAHQDRARVVADEHRPKISLPALRVAQAFLVDGFAAGTWSIARAKTAATLTLTPFATLPKKSRAGLEEEAERVARFHEPDASSIGVRIARA